MKTIVLEEPGRFSFIEDASPPKPATDEALVRVRRVGVCGTDLHAFEGTQPYFSYPRIIGHELGVEIVAVGENARGLAAGNRCAVQPYLHCGNCVACRRGKTNCCERMRVMGVHVDGGLREMITVPIGHLYASSRLTFDQLALVEMLSIGAHAVRRSRLAASDSVLVIGCGPIGLSAAVFALRETANVAVMDSNKQRLEFCRQALSVQTLLASPDTLPRLKEIFSGDLPTVVFDCTGNAGSMHNAFQWVASGGALIFVGLFKGEVTFQDPEFHRREMTLYATRNATEEDFRRVIQALEEKEIDVLSWITHRVPSTRMIDHFPTWLRSESRVIKAMVDWD